MKQLLCLFFCIILLSCTKEKTIDAVEKKRINILPASKDLGANDTEDRRADILPASERVKTNDAKEPPINNNPAPKESDANNAKQKKSDINFTREELNKKYDEYGFAPLGTYFWEEFSPLKTLYDLSVDESELLGRWSGFDNEYGYRYERYYFFPNGLFLIDCMFYYFFKEQENEPQKRLNKGIGVWHIKGGEVFAQIHAFITQETIEPYKKELLMVEPYKVKITDMKFIDPAGYFKRPFENFEVPLELKDKLLIAQFPEDEDYFYFMIRNVYSINTVRKNGEPEKNYAYFTILPQMAEAGLSGLDVAQSPDLIKKYIWDLWP